MKVTLGDMSSKNNLKSFEPEKEMSESLDRYLKEFKEKIKDAMNPVKRRVNHIARMESKKDWKPSGMNPEQRRLKDTL